MRSRPLVASLAVLLSAAPALAGPPKLAPLHGGLPLAFVKRPAVDGSRRMIAPRAAAPVTVHFASPPVASDLKQLAALGVTVAEGAGGRPAVVGSFVVAELPASSLQAVRALPGVTRIALDGAPFRAPHPLDYTAALVQASDIWRTEWLDGTKLTGAGVTICDIDSGADVFHPLFFRADGGYFAWIDVDGDGAFTPGVDGVDMAGDGNVTVLRVQDGVVTNFWDDTPLFGSDNPSFAAGMDWLYADANGNQTRDFGKDAGFTEADPTYGERLFVADDVNRNGKLDVGEKIVALGTSKFASVRIQNKTYRRGKDLINLPVISDFAHGTGASGVLAGGQPGLSRLVGMAPDADLIMTHGDNDVAMANYCLAEGARVVLHEYAPWVGYHLDGSSPMESLIDATSQKADGEGVAHINPAGNLSGSKKLSKRMIPAGQESIVEVSAPEDRGPYTVLLLSAIWRDPSRALTVTLEDPTGASRTDPGDGSMLYEDFHDGLKIYLQRETSSRGTVRVDAYVFSEKDSNPPPVPTGTWKLRVTDPTPAGAADLELITYVEDDASGWGEGISFPDHVSEDHLIGYPGTADHGLAVAAFTGHGWNGGTPGTRAGYSGRGHRIDGAPLLWISAPDDPITAGYHEGSPGRLFVYSGTSGASPHVAGCAALLLQAHPEWSGEDVKQAIRKGALADEVVGTTPNDDYGHGKLRAYQSLYGEAPPGGSPPILTIDRVTVAPGAQANVPVEARDPDEASSGITIELDRDYDGVFEEKLEQPSFSVRYDAEGTYRVKVRATDGTGRAASAFAVIEVKKPEPVIDSGHLVAGGGCAAGGPAREGGAAVVVGIAALAGALRRRRRG